MKFVFLGPPGVGKGTYASRISPMLGIPHISTGDIFRDEVKRGTALGKKIKSVMEAGGLVSDGTVIEVLAGRLKRPDCAKGFILDGFPRTLEQAKALEKLTGIDAVLNIILPEDVLIEKISARRVCRGCGDIYNIASIKRDGIDMPPLLPRKEGKCDKCSGELYQRADDKADVVRERLRNYEKQTKPLVDYFRSRGLLRDFRATAGPEKMVPEIVKILRKYGK